MAVPEAVRRSRSLLLRALAVGGMATAAWLVCAGVASASPDESSDEVSNTLDLVNAAFGEQGPASADLLTGEAVSSFPAAEPAYGLSDLAYGSTAYGATEYGAVEYGVTEYGPTVFAYRPDEVEPRPLVVPFGMSYEPADSSLSSFSSLSSYESEEEQEGSYSDDGVVYSHSGYSHNGSVSNAMPAPLYEAKVAAKAAARAAAEAALAPPAALPEPAPVVAAVPTVVVEQPQAFAAPDSPQAHVTSTHEVTWEVPEPSAPAPAPKQAPAPSAPTASSNSVDNGGGHRGGLLASFTGQSNPKPPTAWSAERRDDGRSPGSIPGLPSTSPD